MDVTARKCDCAQLLAMWSTGGRQPRELAVLAYRLQAKGDWLASVWLAVSPQAASNLRPMNWPEPPW